jgi:HSP20 family protein
MKEQTEKKQTQQNAPDPGERQSSTQTLQAKDEQSKQQRERPTDDEQKEQYGGMRRLDWLKPSMWTENPIAIMRRFSDEIDRFFEDSGLRRGWFGSRGKQNPQDREFGQGMWSPQIEVFERNNQLTICADLPGLKKEDIVVEFSGNVLTIKGERRHEQEKTEKGYRQSERSYGRFYRSIPLPEGIEPENAKAIFQNGVLTITMSLPQQEEPRSRHIEIHSADG